MTDDALRRHERRKYDAVWQLPEYRIVNHGLRLWASHREIFPAQVSTALDIGCGTGRLFRRWIEADGIDGYGVDLSAYALDFPHPSFSHQCLWDMEFDRVFDLGVCCDVMEHIPPERVDDVLARIAACCRESVLQIANYPSSFGHSGPLHLSLHPAAWWLEALGRHGRAEQIDGVGRPGVEEYVFRLAS